MLKVSLEMFSAARSQTLALVSDLTQSQLDYEPAPGKWSVRRGSGHLILCQRLNLCYGHDQPRLEKR
jgi:hypothetical protein